MHPMRDILAHGLIADGVFLRPIAQNDQLPCLIQPRKGAHQPRQVLDRTQPRNRPQPLLARPLDHARQAISTRALAIGGHINAIGDALDLARRLLPFSQRNLLQQARGHHQRARAAKANPPIPIAKPRTPRNLILIEAIFMMDQRRRACGLPKQRMRHHRIHRAEIISQHQIMPGHGARQRIEPRRRRPAL